jgi:hypothetical protein
MSTLINPEIAFENAAWFHQRRYIERNARFQLPMVNGPEGQGQKVLICGSGPSLGQTFDDTYHDVKPDQVWGCNAALKWLDATGRAVTHGVAVAGEDGLVEDWKPFPNVEYLVSSGVSPIVVKLLRNRHRKVRFYHTLLGPKLGVADERAFYGRLFPTAMCVVPSGGFNVTNIAVQLAIGMQFSAIYVLGADCCLSLSPDPRPDPNDASVDNGTFQAQHTAWKAKQQMYVDGRDPVTAYGPNVILPEGIIGGRRFVSRPDMLLSAVHLVELARRYPARLRLIGDTLPNWLLQLPDEQWRPFMPSIQGQVVRNFAPMAPTLDS